MTTLTDDDLIRMNRQGLIPGPHEEEEEFLRRADYCLHLKEKIMADLSKELPLSKEDLGESSIMEEAFPKTNQLYDMVPEWIPVFFSNYKLSPWHGGCAWIFQVAADTPVGAFFQLRQKFKTSRHYLGIYGREELIAHELAHVGRMRFEEPVFEEVLSYRTAGSWFRRWFGPIVQASWESMLFVVSLFLIFVVDISLASFHQHEAFQIAMWFKIFPVVLLTLAFGRLFIKQRQFAAALQRLAATLSDDQKANAVLYRLRDVEIKAFGKMTPEQIRDYAHQQQGLRWRLLRVAYFK